MNTNELNNKINELTSKKEYIEWLNKFPFDISDFENNSEKEINLLCRLLSHSIYNEIDSKCLFLQIPNE